MREITCEYNQVPSSTHRICKNPLSVNENNHLEPGKIGDCWVSLSKHQISICICLVGTCFYFDSQLYSTVMLVTL